MPTYQYRCTECGHAFEQFQSFTDDALTVCPECSGRLRKVFNAVGVVFKGSGFYRNDSRKADTSATSSTSGGDTAGSGTSTSTESGSSAPAKPSSDSSPSTSSTSSSSSSSSASSTSPAGSAANS